MALTATQILKSKDRKQKQVMVPEWACEEVPAEQAFVYVRSLTGKERDCWEETVNKQRTSGEINIRGLLVLLSTVDDHGNNVFTEDDLEELGNKSSAPLSRIFNAALGLSGVSPGDVEELEGN